MRGTHAVGDGPAVPAVHVGEERLERLDPLPHAALDRLPARVVDDPRHDVERERPLLAADVERDALVEVGAGQRVDAGPQLLGAAALDRLVAAPGTRRAATRRRRSSRPTPRRACSRRTGRPSSRSYGGCVPDCVVGLCHGASQAPTRAAASAMRSSGWTAATRKHAGRRRAVELAGRHDDAGPLGQVAGGGPGVAVRAPATQR